ncbi:unnamed protein product, partial [Laminaria digitata]
SEFKAVITLLQLRFEKVSPVTFVQKWLPDVYFSDWWRGLCKVIKHPWFEYGVDVVLILNSILLVMESASALSGTSSLKSDAHVSAWLNSCLGWVYMLEMLLKILVFG